MKYACPVCKKLVFDEPNGNYNVCPVCIWEDDPYQFHEVKQDALGANGNISLNNAVENYQRWGLSDISINALILKFFHILQFKRYDNATVFRYREEAEK